jgi:hypothetical protein
MYRKYLFIIICLQKIYSSRDTISLNKVWPLFSFFSRLLHCLLVQIHAYTDLKQSKNFYQMPETLFCADGCGAYARPSDPWRPWRLTGW